MNNLSSGPRNKRHTLSDWLTLHKLDPATCRELLDSMTWEGLNEPVTNCSLQSVYQAVELGAAWSATVEAMTEFLPEQKSTIDDTFVNTPIVVDNRSHRAFTLDKGPKAYPTIVLSYRDQPRDFLVVAHEFAHALQIRASRGKNVPPMIREICAFLGESALLSYTLRAQTTHHVHLAQAWRKANQRYFGAQRDRLREALLNTDAPYEYSWNYPIARFLAIQIFDRGSQEWIWGAFEGGASVNEVLQQLRFPVVR